MALLLFRSRQWHLYATVIWFGISSGIVMIYLLYLYSLTYRVCISLSQFLNNRRQLVQFVNNVFFCTYSQ